MNRLKQYFGDTTKVVQCVVNQIRQPDNISESNYRGLVNYSTILEQNNNRLLSMDLEHEMSNHSIMSIIVKKFPCSIEERWHDHLIDRSPSEKAKPFPVFIQWLCRQKQKWSSMISTDDTMEVYFSEDVRTRSEGRLCFGCGEPVCTVSVIMNLRTANGRTECVVAKNPIGVVANRTNFMNCFVWKRKFA